jgi:hypothetical protein
MVIKEGEPWLLWPDNVSYGINRGNISETFEGVTDFTLSINLSVLTQNGKKRTIFAKLPNYCGVDIEFNNRLLLILNTVYNGVESHKYLTSTKEIYDEWFVLTYRYNLQQRLVELLVNEDIILTYLLRENETFTQAHDPHIIFAAGNFPTNGVNLNFCSFVTDFLVISKSYMSFDDILRIKETKQGDKTVIGLYDFNKTTVYKIDDISNHCNYIHKII